MPPALEARPAAPSTPPLPSLFDAPAAPAPPRWVDARPRPRRRALMPPAKRLEIEREAFLASEAEREAETRRVAFRGVAEVALAVVATITFGVGWAAWEAATGELDAGASASGYAGAESSAAAPHATAATRDAERLTPWRIDNTPETPETPETPDAPDTPNGGAMSALGRASWTR